MNEKDDRDVQLEAKNLTVATQRTQNVFISTAEYLWTRMGGETQPLPTKHSILKDVSFHVQGPGVTAIIGPSGSGKTTLLDTLSGRLGHAGVKQTGSVAIRCNGRKVNPSSRQGRVAYVPQHDVLIPALTVRESLCYAADLHQDFPSRKDRDAAVQNVILALRLSNCVDVKVGAGPNRGCSGGEAKRTSIASHLLKHPQVLILDEPTTGLDSKAALETVQVLRELADSGKAVLMTAHQPRSEIWKLVDNILLLSQGTVLYAGPTDRCIRHFESIGFSLAPFTNPFEFLSDLIAVDSRTKRNDMISRARVCRLRQLWAARQGRLCHGNGQHGCAEKDDQVHIRLKERSPFWRELSVHIRRAVFLTLKDRLGLLASVLECTCMGLVCGLIFFQTDKDLRGIRSREGALYFSCTMQSYLLLLYNTYRLTEGLNMFDNERADGIVSPITFYLSRRIAGLLLEDVTMPLIFSAIFYFMANLRDGGTHFLVFFLVQFLIQMISVNLAMICATMSRKFITSSLIGSSYYTLQCLTAGFFINTKTLPIWTRWMKWVSYMYYAFSAVCSNEFTNNFYQCPASDDPSDPICREFTGGFIMASLNLPGAWLATPLAALCGYAIVLSAFALLRLYPRPSKAVIPLTTGEPREDGGETREDGCEEPGYIPERSKPVWTSVCSVSVFLKENGILRRRHARPIVQDISTVFCPGRVNAIMGPSGCGKSTLLDAIGGRLHQLRYAVSGAIEFNGQRVETRDIASVCSVLSQKDDGLMPSLTVRETLTFAALLRLPATLTKSQKLQHAEDVLKLLGLASCADGIVGDSNMRGISGGERRRVSIAIQVLMNPSVLLLDEPTSGLDAFTASAVLDVLHTLAATGCTIIMAIHQPRWEYVQQFGSLLILSSRGRMAFSGVPDQLLHHFEHRLNRQCPSLTNPADFVIDNLTEESASKTAAEENQKPLVGISRVPKTLYRSSTIIPASLGLDRRRALPIHRALRLLLERGMRSFRRTPTLLLGRIFQVAGFGILLLIFFTPLRHDSFSAQTRLGLIGQSSALFFVGMQNAVSLFPSELSQFLYEHRDGIYHAESFFASYTVMELPLDAVAGLLLSGLIVLPTGLPRSADLYFLMAFTSFALVFCGESAGIAFLTIVRHRGLALATVSVLLALCIAVGGVVSLSVPRWLQALNNLSPVKWQVRASATLSMRSIAFTCNAEQRLPNGHCQIETGRQVLQLYDMDVSTARAVAVLAGLTVASRLAAYLVLKLNCWRLRRTAGG